LANENSIIVEQSDYTDLAEAINMNRTQAQAADFRLSNSVFEPRKPSDLWSEDTLANFGAKQSVVEPLKSGNGQKSVIDRDRATFSLNQSQRSMMQISQLMEDPHTHGQIM